MILLLNIGDEKRPHLKWSLVKRDEALDGSRKGARSPRKSAATGCGSYLLGVQSLYLAFCPHHQPKKPLPGIVPPNGTNGTP
jgi:hypothetical protein